MERTTARDRETELEYVIVCDEGMPEQVRERVTLIATRPVRFVDHTRGPDGFNFARMVNGGALASDGDVLVFVNDDVAMLSEGWLHEVVPLAVLPDVGAVGIRLLFPDRTIQHLGVTVQPAHGGWPVHQNYGLSRDDPANGGWLAQTREVVAVTGAFLAVARSTFLEVGGFSTEFAINHNDVDLCLKLGALGHRTLVVPRVSAVHAESSSREPGATDGERAEVKARWGVGLTRDPYRNPRLSWQDMSPSGA
jgi:GT2 family glycosyltransferase